MYVAITSVLLAAVKENIRNLRNKERNEVKYPDAPTLDGTEEFIRRFWGPLYGTEFEGHAELSRPKKVSVCIRDIDPDEVTPDTEHHHHSHYTVSGVKMPRWVDEGYGGVKVFVGTDDHEAYDEYARKYRDLNEINGRWSKVEEQILGFLRTTKSLNEALKLWPDVRRYLPADAITKVETKTEKTKRDRSEAMQKLAEMDLDTITSSTVLARMASAGEQT